MSTSTVLFRVSLALSLVGGSIAVLGSWLLGQPSDGANIGAGLIVLLATVLMGTALLAWVVGLIVRAASRPGRRARTGAVPASA